MFIHVNAFEIIIYQNGSHFVHWRWVLMSWLWPSFCLSHSYQAQQCKTWFVFSWNIASTNSTWFFHFNQNAYVHIYTTSVKVDFIPPIMCSNEQMFRIHLSWLLAIIALVHKYIHFEHYLVPGTFLIRYGFLCSVLVSVTTNVCLSLTFLIMDKRLICTRKILQHAHNITCSLCSVTYHLNVYLQFQKA